MRLFISYAHDDKSTVKSLIVDYLRVEGHDVWFDDRLTPGSAWKEQLRTEIERSDGIVFAVSPASLESEWCQWELFTGAQLGKKTLPIVIKPVDSLPVYLAQIHYVDFSSGLTADNIQQLRDGLDQMTTADAPPPTNDPQGQPPQARRSLWPLIWRIGAFASAAILFLVTIFGVLPEQTRDEFFVAVGLLDPTATPTPPPTAAPTLTATVTLTLTAPPAETTTPTATSTTALTSTLIVEPSQTHTPTPTDATTLPATATNTPPATSAPSQAYPCEGHIPGVSGLLNQVHVQPSENSPSRPPVARGSTVTILRETSDFGVTWYEIEYNGGDDRGWIPDEHVEPSGTCPTS